MIRFKLEHKGKGSIVERIRSGLPVEKIVRAMKATGDRLLEESRKLCPQDTTSLVQSSRVRQEGSGLETTIIVGYGIKGDEYEVISPREGRIVTRIPYDYAVMVHEAGHGKYAKVPPPVSGHIEFLAGPLRSGLDDLRGVCRSVITAG